MPPESTFKIFVPLLKASRDGDGRRRFHGVASSSIKDRHGDTITQTALSEMERTASENMTIFLNHKYEVPEDVAGSVERASMRSHPTDPTIQDLMFDIVVNEANERAVKAWEAIDNGTKLGLSIGARIPDGGATRVKETGRYVIDHIDLLETSIVGVPANPRSWVEYAVKSLNGMADSEERWSEGTGVPMVGIEAPADGTMVLLVADEPEVVKAPMSSDTRNNLPDSAFACPSKRKYPHHTASGAIDKAHLRNALSRCGDASNDRCGCAHIRAHAAKLGIGDSDKSFDELLVFALEDGVTEEHFASVEAEDGPTFEWNWEAEDDEVVEASIDPSVEKAKKPAEHEHPHAHEHDHGHEHWNGIVHSHEHAHTHAHAHDDSHEHVDDMQGSEHDHSHADSYGDEDHAHEEDGARKDDQPTLEGVDLAAHLDEFQVTNATESSDGAASAPQEAPSESGPGNGEAPADDARELDLQPTLKASLGVTNELLISITRELVEAKTALVRTEQERDRAVELAEKAVNDTSALLKRLAATPMGKRTQVTDAIQDFESLKSVYGEAFVDLLKKKD